MNECAYNYYVLALAILAPRALNADQAFEAFEKMSLKGVRNKLADIVPDMIKMRESGMRWREIAECMNMTVGTAMTVVARYKRRNSLGEGVVNDGRAN